MFSGDDIQMYSYNTNEELDTILCTHLTNDIVNIDTDFVFGENYVILITEQGQIVLNGIGKQIREILDVINFDITPLMDLVYTFHNLPDDYFKDVGNLMVNLEEEYDLTLLLQFLDEHELYEVYDMYKNDELFKTIKTQYMDSGFIDLSRFGYGVIDKCKFKLRIELTINLLIYIICLKFERLAFLHFFVGSTTKNITEKLYELDSRRLKE